MNPFDDLPERHPNHDTALAAESAFEAAIAGCTFFVIQQKDRFDYGTDFQIEARHGNDMTNLRVHVQMKGTTVSANADGSVSIQVDRKNLNYLLAQPDALFACFHLPSAKLFARYATDVVREYEHRGNKWGNQDQVTVRFTETFDQQFQHRLHACVIAVGRSARNRRLEWAVTPPKQIPALVQRLVHPVEFPADPEQASAMLTELYNAGEDAVISASFSRIAAVLDGVPAMGLAYMAEINLGINGCAFDETRVRRGIEVL